MLIRTSILLGVFHLALFNFVGANKCKHLEDVPMIEATFPSLQHSLKFLNVDATVYRHTQTKGSLPRLRILEYSSTPVIDMSSSNNEIIISTQGNSCLNNKSNKKSAGYISRANVSLLFMSLAAASASTYRKIDFLVFTSIGLLSFNFVTVESAGANIECTPSMKVVLEAPPYYLGSVDECLAEVSNIDHCPDSFPTFKTCSNSSPSCKLAVVGAGTGGLYAAMRLVEEGKFSASDICIFEATERVGGRIYSLRGFGPENDITVDAGAYRTWPQYTPTTHALIEKLGFQMECYEDEDPCQKYNIISKDGEKSGFASFVEEMMRILVNQGACFFPRHELTSIVNTKAGEVKTLSFANGVSATADKLILNVPQRPLLKIIRKSDLPLDSDEEAYIFNSLHSVQTEIVAKLYLYYNNAWWYDLGLTNGDFEMPGDARNMVVKGRYHDGHVKCNNGDCYGFLLADYVHDFGGEQSQFFRRYQRDRPEPVTIISNTDSEGGEFLKHAHDRLVEFHLYKNQNASYTPFQAETLFRNQDTPEFGVLATWNIGTYGAGGGWHHWTDLGNIEKAMKPMNQLHIHVINEAYSKLQGWAEGSLLLADEVLEEFFDVKRPWDFEAPDYVQFVAQTTSQACEEVEEDQGNTDGGQTGGGDGSVDLCFTKDAMVLMADGSKIHIDQIQIGDQVSTGFDGEIGRVTEVLVHRVQHSSLQEREIDVVVISTGEDGDLIGTPSHPIFVNGQWMEMQEAVKLGAFDGSKMFGTHAKKTVDILYNLEIDGDMPGLSSHSFVVNGIIASGLGDNYVLNTLYARQNLWKMKTQ